MLVLLHVCVCVCVPIVQLVKEVVVEGMAHSREGVASGGSTPTPTPSPSDSGQSATHMDLTHSNRAGGYIRTHIHIYVCSGTYVVGLWYSSHISYVCYYIVGLVLISVSYVHII